MSRRLPTSCTCADRQERCQKASRSSTVWVEMQYLDDFHGYLAAKEAEGHDVVLVARRQSVLKMADELVEVRKCSWMGGSLARCKGSLSSCYSRFFSSFMFLTIACHFRLYSSREPPVTGVSPDTGPNQWPQEEGRSSSVRIVRTSWY